MNQFRTENIQKVSRPSCRIPTNVTLPCFKRDVLTIQELCTTLHTLLTAAYFPTEASKPVADRPNVTPRQVSPAQNDSDDSNDDMAVESENGGENLVSQSLTASTLTPPLLKVCYLVIIAPRYSKKFDCNYGRHFIEIPYSCYLSATKYHKFR